MVMNWMQLQWSAVQLHWVHDISQSALALAVATLGVVILLELASVARLRRTFDVQMQRLFEQLDLLRGDNLQLLESQRPPASAQSRPAPASAPAATATGPASAAGTAMTPYAAPAPVPAPTLGGGEARLLAALTAARARLGRTEGSAPRA